MKLISGTGAALNTKLMAGMLDALTHPLDPPGSSGGFVDHPTDPSKAVEIGVVLQHRFAFHYWLKWHGEARQAGTPAPHLLTLDWHDDVGGDCDFTPGELTQLDPTDPNELSLFCWSRLRSLNDGHIAPAQYLNALGDVYVVLKQKADERGWVAGPRRMTQVDRHGTAHRVHYYDTVGRFLSEHGPDPIHPVVLDLDLDYFTTPDGSGEKEAVTLVSDREIEAVVSPDGPLMRWVLPRLAGLTIALEPEYCGGVWNCMHVLDVVSNALFDPPLLSPKMQWRWRR